MARTRTLTQLLADLRYAADIEGQTLRHPDSSLTRELNQSIAAYRREHPEWYATTATGATTAGSATLPSLTSPTTVAWDTVDRLIRLSITTPDSVTTVLYPYEPEERHDYSVPLSLAQPWPTMYRREGASIIVIPTPQTVMAIEAYYLPQLTDLATGSDTFDPVLSGGEQWVIYDAAMRVAVRDMSPRVGALQQLRDDAAKQLSTGAREPGPARRVDTWGRRAVGTSRRWW